MRLNKKILISKIGLSVFTSLVVIFLFEIVLRITYPLYSNYNTEMWRYAAELKQISNLPGIGHEHLPNKTVTLYNTEIRTNSLGFRGDKEYYVPKPKGKKRILVLGDSITMGWGVKFADTYPKVLESLLNKNSSTSFEVINTAVGNYNTVSELAVLKKSIHLDPDAIILGFYINDIETVKYPSKLFYFFYKNSYLYCFIIDKYINIKYRGVNDYNHFYMDLYRNEKLKGTLKFAIIEMMKIAEDKCIPFIFVNIPEFHKFQHYSFLNVNEFIENEVIPNKDIVYIDMLQTFQNIALPPTELWVSHEDPHPNAKAHKIIAYRIYNEIINSDVMEK